MPINRTVVPPNGTPVEHPVPYISGTARAVRCRHSIPHISGTARAVRCRHLVPHISGTARAVRFRPVSSGRLGTGGLAPNATHFVYSELDSSEGFGFFRF
jgi:hypothetical protein